MTSARIAELLEPFLPARLAEKQLDQISIYIDLLLHWNARVNLTAIRSPEEVVTRHFGESLFSASRLLPCGADSSGHRAAERGASVGGASAGNRCAHVIDLGSGAGFPGIPLKIWSPRTPVTLIESSHKKATFLREAIRALALTSIDVFADRAQAYPQASADLVTLRAVEQFESVLPVACALLAPSGRIALLIGESQIAQARKALSSFAWLAPIRLPGSQSRVLLVGEQQ